MQASISSPRFPESDREVRSVGPGRSPDCRQLLHPQARQSPTLAGGAVPIPYPLHAQLGLLAQPGAAVVGDRHPASNPEGQRLQRQRADRPSPEGFYLQ
jgi:hypothetical protein